VREGACIGGATTPQPSMLRLIRNAAAFAAASPTLLFKPWDRARGENETRPSCVAIRAVSIPFSGAQTGDNHIYSGL
jgi:hypothetical protein